MVQAEVNSPCRRRWTTVLIQPYEKNNDYGIVVLPATAPEVMKRRRAGLEQSVKRTAEFR